MEPIIQPLTPFMTNAACTKAEAPQPLEQPFNDVLLRQDSPNEEKTNPSEKCVDETVSLNLLPIFAPATAEQTTPNLLASASSLWEGNDLLLANQLYLSQRVIPMHSQFDGEIAQIKGTLSKPELNQNLLNQREAIISPLGTFSEFNERLDLLPELNSARKTFLDLSLDGDFAGVGNSAQERNDLKKISVGENQPTKESYVMDESLGSPKPLISAGEMGIHQKLWLLKTDHLDFYQRICEKISWSIRNNEEKIRLTLDPPQLGNLYIEIHRNKEEIKASLWTDNSMTKEILENNQFQLQKTLEGNGFKLEKYEVFVQSDMGAFQRNDENHIFHDKESRTQSLEIQESELSQPLEVLAGIIRVAGKSKYVDRFV